MNWKDCVSSGFDRLVAFASTELHKTRRSIEDVAGPHPSRSASPDSGITQNVLSSTSSTSSTSQLESSMVVSKSMIPMAKVSPGEAVSEKSSPPQTPSPAASPSIAATAAMMRHGSPTLKIPLKYQRQSKVKHYKKKFRDRKWEYDEFAESDVFTSGEGGGGGGGASLIATNDREQQHSADAEEMGHRGLGQHSAVQLKTSKFRPKGKDWGRGAHHDGSAD